MPKVGRWLVPFCALVLAALPARAQQRPSSRLITAEEIERIHAASAFDAVQSLRPRWLRAREVVRLPDASNAMEMESIRVYMEDRDMGDVEYLKTIPGARILTLQYMTATEAGARFGPSRGPGIVVTLKP